VYISDKLFSTERGVAPVGIGYLAMVPSSIVCYNALEALLIASPHTVLLHDLLSSD
jgi:hypothetical protein